MSLRVCELNDAAEALRRAGAFLTAAPTAHNLMLTVLDQSIDFAVDGRFWIVEDDAAVIGYAWQSPPGFRLGSTSMPVAAAHALADVIDPPIPGIIAEPATAAAFAGRFTERHHLAGAARDGGRLYELVQLRAVASAPGVLRAPVAADRDILVGWTLAFARETDTSARSSDAESVVDLAMARGQIWVWDHDGPVSMTGASKAAAGVARVQRVYTPPERRGAGYATACVEHVSRLLTDRGLRCVLYTELGNPTSNAIYRAIGYEAIGEVLAYEFG